MKAGNPIIHFRTGVVTMLRRAVLSLVVLTAVLGACSRRQPPPAPTPEPTQPDTAAENARRRQQALADSIARANAERDRLANEARERSARARSVLEELVYFDYDRSDIRSDQQEVLTRKVAVLRANPNVAIRIIGHADERGSVEYNLALGMRRAEEVRRYLTGFGIDASRFSTETMGEDRPLDPGTTEAAYARNRRAEFTITRGGENLVMPGQE
jgi:peptidoglycan-associated lipoprotein